MEISNALYDWLQQPLNLAPLKRGATPRLSETLLDFIDNGQGLIPLMLRLKDITPPKLKPGNSVPVRLHNWKHLNQSLASMGVGLDSKAMKLLTAGDREALISLLLRLQSLPYVTKSNTPKEGVYIDCLLYTSDAADE